MTLLHQIAVSQLRRAGYRVFPPVPAPRPSSQWQPASDSLARFVDACAEGRVTYYVCGAGEPPKSCSIATWRRWVQRARAKEVGL